MFKEQMNKIKSWMEKKAEKINQNEESNEEVKTNKRKIENLVAFLIILIITLIAINAILGGEKETESKNEDSSYKILADMQMANSEVYADELEKRLENILETMEGVRQGKGFNYIYTI